MCLSLAHYVVNFYVILFIYVYCLPRITTDTYGLTINKADIKIDTLAFHQHYLLKHIS